MSVLIVAIAAVHPAAIRADGTKWCRTVSPDATASVAASGVCPTRGVCDEPGVRDAAIPDESGPIVTIRLKLNVFREDDGTNPAVTAALLEAQVTRLQADFLPHRIQFAPVVEFINDSASRNFVPSHESDMKLAHADQPDKQLNVYVVDAVFGSFGSGTFPWTSPLSNFGGVMIDKDLVGPTRPLLSHEMGHALGLWHTKHGVSEVAACSACYELADGSNGDTSGDFCGDTPSTPGTPFNASCLPPDEVDCVGVAFPLVAPANIMGVNEACFVSFTGQQAGRMHCWIADALSSWVEQPTEPVVPAASAWGLAVQGLVLSVFASVVLIRRRPRRSGKA